MNSVLSSLKDWLLNFFLKRTILSLIILVCIGIGIVLSNMSNLSSNLIESQALLNSEAQASSIINAWQLYSQAVVIRLGKVKEVTIDHNYFLKEASIPPPATFAIQLGNNISNEAQNNKLFIRLYSDYPWPWRKSEGGPHNSFEKEALAYFKDNPEEHQFYRIETNNRRSMWRYAQAVIMETSCVACHNTHPDSPKKDWNVGDVRGAIEIVQPLDKITQTSNQGLKQTFMMLGGLSILSISGLGLVMGRLNQTTKDLEKRVYERTATLAEANENLEQRNVLIRQVFGRYLSDEIVENLLQSPHSLSLGGERRRVTILTSDLRGFTAISEKLSAEEVISILNIYLEKIADIINQYHGTINEIMGDGILVLFGAPTERDDDAEKAIACAVAMQLAMTDVNQKLKKLGFPQLEMGIGINTGLVILGNIGSEKRTKYGVVGSQVNLTYRIESFSVGGEILLAESTFNECQSLIRVRGQKQVQAKGVKEAITIYELEGIGGSYNLYLPQQSEVFKTLPEPIAIQYQVLEEKHLDLAVYSGRLTELSRKGAKIVLDSTAEITTPSRFTNLKFNLCYPSEISEDIYAKVSEQEAEPKSFYVHFTSRTLRLEKIIEQNFSD